MKKEVVLIFDIGKTNKKILLFDSELKIIHEEETIFEEIPDDDDFEGDDIDVTGDPHPGHIDDLPWNPWAHSKREGWNCEGQNSTLQVHRISTEGANLIQSERFRIGAHDFFQTSRWCNPLFSEASAR